jgi:hypothetical protein
MENKCRITCRWDRWCGSSTDVTVFLLLQLDLLGLLAVLLLLLLLLL